MRNQGTPTNRQLRVVSVAPSSNLVSAIDSRRRRSSFPPLSCTVVGAYSDILSRLLLQPNLLIGVREIQLGETLPPDNEANESSIRGRGIYPPWRLDLQ